MTHSTEPSSLPAAGPGNARRHEWAVALIAACLALGIALAWGQYELRQRSLADGNLRAYRQQVDTLSARDGDLGDLLADPNTKFVRLQTDASGELNPLRRAAIAWNDGRQRGVLFCDNLAPAGDGKEYQLWLIPDAGAADATAVGLVDAQPGKTVYAFSPMGRAEPRQFVLTLGRPVTLLSRAEVLVARASLD